MEDPCDETDCGITALVVLATTVWAIVDAVDTARDHNARIRGTMAGLLVAPSPVGGVAVGLRLAR